MRHRFGDNSRTYAQSHPWIKFLFRLTDLEPIDFTRIGEALSKSDHIAAAPLPPVIANELHKIFLVKGVHATTQIEGNTLSEEEVRARVSGDLELPESQEYLGREVDNIVKACNSIGQDVREGRDLRLTRERIESFNAMVLDGLPLDDDVTPGKIRTMSVVVGGGIYRGAPAEDCEYLLDQLCKWLHVLPDAGADWSRPMKLLRAILAHLYLAWIHPFGDGNGRTARLVEFQLLLEAGFPSPACHLLSNYYNRTRQIYYKVLRETSRAEPYPVEKFVSYAVKGFVEELRDQLKMIQGTHMGLAWVNFVQSVEVGKSAETVERRRAVVHALPADHLTPISSVDRLTPDLAARYANKSKTVSRDINVLVKAGLLAKEGTSVRPRTELMLSFLPLRNQSLWPES
jgi:Fic family protein